MTTTVMRFRASRLALFSALLLAGCAPFHMSRETVTITGDFFSDERCVVQTPRGSLADSNGVGRTFYSFGGAFNVVPDGYALHTIWCRVVTPTDSDGLSGGRWLQLSFAVRGGQSIAAGRYAITESALFDTAAFTSTAGVAHPAYDVGTPGSGVDGTGGHIELEGFDGVLELTRIDPPGIPEAGLTLVPHPHVLGHFTIRARRVWGM